MKTQHQNPVARTKSEIQQELQKHFSDHVGDVKLVWETHEYDQPQRGLVWHIVAGAIAAGLLIYAVVDGNFLFGVMIVVIAFLIALRSLRKPDLLLIAITNRGIVLHDRFYDFESMESFWIIYEPPAVTDIGITFTSKWRPELLISLQNTNPLHVRKLLSQYLVEEERKESLSSALGRVLKI